MSTEFLPISVIMVTFHTGEILVKAIDNVLANNVKEFIIVNNGNPEPFFATIRKRLQSENRVKIIEGQGNIGYAAACNLGASHAAMPYYLFINPDINIEECTLSELYHKHCALPQPVVTGAWVTGVDGQVQRGTLRNKLSPLTLAVEGLKLNRYSSYFNRFSINYDSVRNNENTPIRTTALNGACIMIDAQTYKRINGFDEGYFLHFEDLDLFARLTCPIYLLPSVKVIHQKGTSDVEANTLNFHKYNGFCRYFRKHYPLFWYSPAGWAVKWMARWRAHRIFSS